MRSGREILISARNSESKLHLKEAAYVKYSLLNHISNYLFLLLFHIVAFLFKVASCHPDIIATQDISVRVAGL
jgi:hypothetical protein